MYPKVGYQAILSVNCKYNELQIQETAKPARGDWMQGLEAFSEYATVGFRKKIGVGVEWP